MQKALTVGGGHPPPPLARSARSGLVASLPRTLKLNPGYATEHVTSACLLSIPTIRHV